MPGLLQRNVLTERYLLLNYALPLAAARQLLPVSERPWSRTGGMVIGSVLLPLAHMTHQRMQRILIFHPHRALFLIEAQAADVAGPGGLVEVCEYTTSFLVHRFGTGSSHQALFNSSVDDAGAIAVSAVTQDGGEYLRLLARPTGAWQPSKLLPERTAGEAYCRDAAQPFLNTRHPLAGAQQDSVFVEACAVETAEASLFEALGGVALDSVYAISRTSLSVHSHGEVLSFERLRARLAPLAPPLPAGTLASQTQHRS